MSDLQTLQNERDGAYNILKFNVEEFNNTDVEYFIELQEMYAVYIAAENNLKGFKASIESQNKLMESQSKIYDSVGSSIADHMTMRYGQDIITSIVKSNVDSMSSVYNKFKDRVKQGMSPSTEVIEMDCTTPKNLTSFTVVVEGTVTRRINVQARDQKDADNLALDEFNSLLAPDNACVVGYGE